MKEFLHSIHDYRVYILIFPFTLLLFWIDPVVAETWFEWGAALPIIVGLTLLVRKILFSTVDLSETMKTASESPTGAGNVVLAISIVSAAFMISATLWLSR